MSNQAREQFRPLTRPMRIAVIGGSGFVGARVVSLLAKQGCAVRVVARSYDHAKKLMMAGQVGQIAFMKGDIRKEEDMMSAIDGMDGVVNLVGILNESWSGRVLRRGQDYHAIHVQGAERIARLARRFDVKRMLHLSALGAREDSASFYAVTKRKGEKRVQKYMEQAVILRPSVIFGEDDSFFNLFATIAFVSPVLPVFGEPLAALFDETQKGGVKMQPIYAGDVAQAITTALFNEKTHGQIYELGGAHVYDFRQLMMLLLKILSLKRILMPYDKWMMSLAGWLGTYIPSSPFTKEQAVMLCEDNVVSHSYEGVEAFGIKAQALESLLPYMLTQRFLRNRDIKKEARDS